MNKKIKKVVKQSSLENEKIANSVQLELFHHSDNRNDFSNTVEFYDICPKYIWEQRYFELSVENSSIERTFEFNEKTYYVTIKPAIIDHKINGKVKPCFAYPSYRELIIEDMLRKFMCEEQGQCIDNNYAVSFSLAQLYQELKNINKNYSYNEIREAIKICTQTNLTIYEKIDGKKSEITNSSLFMGSKINRDRHKNSLSSFVIFHPLVTYSIDKLDFKLYNFKKAMEYKSKIAILLQKNMSNYFTTLPSLNSSYNFLLSDFYGYLGRGMKKKTDHNTRLVRNALDEMLEKSTIDHYEINSIDNQDFEIQIFPNERLKDEIKMSIEKTKTNRITFGKKITTIFNK
ncbi:MAG: hypothetical protein HON94_15785 [Methylococcales bacterium]|jgi:hypothetical protein|nr:hypothetical protein [Methylococcales bacterium]MBT7408284.1 hypothetical protein [Methylococcales bacterium]